MYRRVIVHARHPHYAAETLISAARERLFGDASVRKSEGRSVRNIAIAGWLRWNQTELTMRSNAAAGDLDFGSERIPQCGYRR